MHRDNQVQKLLRQQRNFTPPPNFNVVVNVQSRKRVKFLLQHCPRGEGGRMF